MGTIPPGHHRRMSPGTRVQAVTPGGTAMENAGPSGQLPGRQLRIREGGGCVSLFGLPFFGAGVFLLLVAVGVVPVENADEVPRFVSWLLLAMGVVFGGVGGGLTFGRRWTTLEPDRGRVRKEWGLLVPMKGETFRLDGFREVLLRLETGDSDSPDQYHVSLRSPVSGETLRIFSSNDYGRSREKATEVVHLLDLPLVDASTGQESVTPAGQVDDPLRARIRKNGTVPEAVHRPRPMECTVQIRGKGILIQRPGPPFKVAGLLTVAVPGAVLALLAPTVLRFFRETGTPEGVQWVALGAGIFFLLLLPASSVLLSLARSVRGGTRIECSPEGIIIQERGTLKTGTTRIPARDIMGIDAHTGMGELDSLRAGIAEMRRSTGPAPTFGSRRRGDPWWFSLLRRLVPSKGILIRTREEVVAVGTGLPDQEVRYLAWVMVRTLGEVD